MVAFAAVLWAVVVSQSVPGAASAVQPPTTGLILGRVVDGTSGRPIAGAIVSLQGGAVAAASRTQPRAITNGNGQFVFRKLTKGVYRMTAVHAGYVDGAYGQRRPAGSSLALDLAEGQRAGDVVIPMWQHASIAGTVVDEAGEPAIGVSVRAYQRRVVLGRLRVTEARSSTTDDRGTYRMTGLVPGSYFVALVWHETSVPNSVSELFRNGVLGNDPKMMEVMRDRISMGAGGISTPGSPSGVQTGGVWRDLAPGVAVPPVGPEDGAVYIYPTQFYPGVPSAARARAITLQSGDTRDGIDFALRPVKASRVSGTVMGLEGPLANTVVHLMPAQDEGLTDLETAATMTGTGGEFTLIGVPSGQYVIKVVKTPRAIVPSNPQMTTTTQISVGSSMVMSSGSSAPNNAPPPPVPDDPTQAGEAAVAVADADVKDVLVTLQRGPRVTGHFEFDGTRDRPDAAAMSRIYVSLEPVETRVDYGPGGIDQSGRGDETGNFKTVGVAPGQYRVRVFGVPLWVVRSIVSDGKDYADTPIEIRAADVSNVTIVFTDRPSKLTGSVRAPDGNPDSASLVVTFPADAANWTAASASPRRLRSVRADKTGNYTISGLPAGEYYVTALREEATVDWQDPQVLEDLARSATLVRIAEGDTVTRDLKSSGGGR
jgi:hypothetical protein